MKTTLGETSEFEKELCILINKYSKESNSDTPDFILADYMNSCLEAFNKAIVWRAEWNGPIEGISDIDQKTNPEH